MRLERVEPGDVVRCAIKGRTGIWGEVTEVKDAIVYFRALCLGTGWRQASAREVVGHWREAGRRGGVDDARLWWRASSCRCPGCTREPRDVDARHVAGASVGGRPRRVAAQLV
jgi:hypothetical protein